MDLSLLNVKVLLEVLIGVTMTYPLIMMKEKVVDLTDAFLIRMWLNTVIKIMTH